MYKLWPILFLAACTASLPARQRPTNLSAEEHRAAAQELRLRAWNHRPPSSGPGETRSAYEGEGHLAEADAHERAAVTLETNHRAACAPVAPGQEKHSPIAQHIESVEDVHDGVRVHLGHTDDSAAQILQQLRCHRAWLARFGSDLSPDEPLGMSDIYLELWRGDDGFELVLTSRHAGDVAELRRRAHALLAHRMEH